jgi:hypothetical protein
MKVHLGEWTFQTDNELKSGVRTKTSMLLESVTLVGWEKNVLV